MFAPFCVRGCVRGLLLLCLGIALVGCAVNGLDSIQVTPATQSLAVGQTVQFTATGSYGNANHLSTRNVTSLVTWTSSSPDVATVNASGVATAVSAGATVITANSTGFAGPVSSTAGLTVTGSPVGTTGGSGASILSLTIIPSGIVFGSLKDSGQFLAIGTFSTAPTVRDVTNSVTWLTSEPNKFPITNFSNAPAPGPGTQNGGVVSAYEASVGNVGAVITAEAKDTDGSIATATANVGCPLILPTPATPPTATSPGSPGTPGSCFQNVPQLLTTLTVYNEGLNTTGWLVTAPSATGTPAVINCGPAAGTGKSVCTATYPLNTTVTLTAPAEKGVFFGGWSSTCFNVAPVTQTGPNTCTVTLSTTDATVGAIFN
jgi:hypothetical protein